MTSRTQRTFGTFTAICLLATLAAWSCEQAGNSAATPAGPTATAASSAGAMGTMTPAAASSTDAAKRSPIDAATEDAMTLALQDEYHAEWAYQDVLDAFGPVKPFTSIHQAELNHIDAASKLFSKRGLPVPASDWADDDPLVFESVAAACEAGVEAELANIALYVSLLDLDLPDDVAKVFQRLMAASLESHLPAFSKCAGR